MEKPTSARNAASRGPSPTADPGDRVFVKFLRRGTPTTAAVVLEEDPRLELLPIETMGERLTDDQRAFRAAWLGSKVKN